MRFEEIEVNTEWENIYKEISTASCSLMVLGDVDTGKTIFSQYLIYKLLHDGKKVSFVDSDIGQSTISPPSTIGIKNFNSKPKNITEICYDRMYFVGDVTPTGHLLQLVTATALAFRKRYNRGYVVIDTTGLVTGSIGNELKIQKIKLIQPDVIIAIQHKQELEPILRNFRHNDKIKMIKMLPYNVRNKSRLERKQNRKQKFNSYFKNSRLVNLKLRNFGFLGRVHDLDELYEKNLNNSIIGLCNVDSEALGLGIVEKIDNKDELIIKTPLEDLSEIENLHFGSFHLNKLDS